MCWLKEALEDAWLRQKLYFIHPHSSSVCCHRSDVVIDFRSDQLYIFMPCFVSDEVAFSDLEVFFFYYLIENLK